MQEYQNFIGIDIGKFSFVVSVHGENTVTEYQYTASGTSRFLEDFDSRLAESFVVLETTGGYEMQLLWRMCSQGINVHRANTRKVKNFIRSYGTYAKTDKLDAKALALYGCERHSSLTLYKPTSKTLQNLYELVQRRCDLKQLRTAEKNRRQGPRVDLIKKSCDAIIDVLDKQIEDMSKQIEAIIQGDKQLRARKAVLISVPGIGEKTAQDLLAFLPELGTLTRRQVASLCGLAPRANDSGKFSGYRSTGHGRQGIKPILFLSAMAARNSHSELGAFYEKLIENGKRKMVALTAVMRKIIVIANARIRDYLKDETAQSCSD